MAIAEQPERQRRQLRVERRAVLMPSEQQAQAAPAPGPGKRQEQLGRRAAAPAELPEDHQAASLEAEGRWAEAPQHYLGRPLFPVAPKSMAEERAEQTAAEQAAEQAMPIAMDPPEHHRPQHSQAKAAEAVLAVHTQD